MDKLENIVEFPQILWNLFDSNILYNFSKFESDKVLEKYWKLFSREKIENLSKNLNKITSEIFIWCNKNIPDPNSFLFDLEKIINKDEKKINESYINELYVNFLKLSYIEKPIKDYLLNYLLKRIIKLDKESLEKLLNIEEVTQSILQYLNKEYKLTKQDFFKKNPII